MRAHNPLPHLFTFSTTDGYSATGCYDTDSSSCYFPAPDGSCHCPQFVPYPTLDDGYAFGQTLGYNAPGQTPVDLAMSVWEDGNNNWQVIVRVVGEDPGIMGYYVGSQFSAPMDTSEVGGEVDNAAFNCDDPNDVFLNSGITMGSGQPPAAGYGQAGYHHDYDAWNNSGEVTGAFVCSTRPEYSFSLVGGQSSWQDFFYYGGNSDGPLNCTGTGSCRIGFVYNPSTCQCQFRRIVW